MQSLDNFRLQQQRFETSLFLVRHSIAVATFRLSFFVVTQISLLAFRSSALQAFPSQVSLASFANRWEYYVPSLFLITGLLPLMLTTLPSKVFDIGDESNNRLGGGHVRQPRSNRWREGSFLAMAAPCAATFFTNFAIGITIPFPSEMLGTSNGRNMCPFPTNAFGSEV
jgi:hypothetical protein